MLNDDVIDFGGIPLLAAADIMEMGGTEMGVAWGKKRDVWDEIGGKTTVWSEMRKKLTEVVELSVERQSPPPPWSMDVFNSTCEKKENEMMS